MFFGHCHLLSRLWSVPMRTLKRVELHDVTLQRIACLHIFAFAFGPRSKITLYPSQLSYSMMSPNIQFNSQGH